MVTKTRKITLISAAVMALVLLTGAKGCGPQGSGGSSSNPSATPFAKPGGAIAPPPANGGGHDPHDPDFAKPAKPPQGAPDGMVTYEVRVQMYNAQGESIGGLSTAYINATALNPRAMGGVEEAGVPSVFPYNKESVRLPFQFPIFVQPGISVSVTSTFHAFADKGEILACWIVSPAGLEVRGTRTDQQAVGNNSLLSVNCSGNIG